MYCINFFERCRVSAIWLENTTSIVGFEKADQIYLGSCVKVKEGSKEFVNHVCIVNVVLPQTQKRDTRLLCCHPVECYPWSCGCMVQIGSILLLPTRLDTLRLPTDDTCTCSKPTLVFRGLHGQSLICYQNKMHFDTTSMCLQSMHVQRNRCEWDL